MVCGGGYVTLGEDCLIGPRCTIATPNHALDAATRLAGWEHASPVTIGDNVWFGANVTVTPGVTIGSNSIIGAGSVVTRDIPANSIAVGNPAHVIREIPERIPPSPMSRVSSDVGVTVFPSERISRVCPYC